MIWCKIPKPIRDVVSEEAEEEKRCVALTILPPSCTNCHEIWDPQPPGILTPVQGLLYLLLYKYILCCIDIKIGNTPWIWISHTTVSMVISSCYCVLCEPHAKAEEIVKHQTCNTTLQNQMAALWQISTLGLF